MANVLRNNKKLKLVLRIALSASILVYIVYKIDWNLVYETLLKLNKYFFVLSLFAFSLEMFLKAYKWKLLLHTIRIKISFWKVLQTYYISDFLGMFMPSALGVDVLRTVSMSKYAKNMHASIFSVFMDRVFGITSLCMIMLIGLYSSAASLVDDRIPLIITGLVIFAMFAVIILLMDRMLDMFSRVTDKFKNKKLQTIHRKIAVSSDYIHSIKNSKLVILWFYMVTVSFQVNRIIITYLVAKALHINIAFGYWIVIVPTVVLISMLPFSVAGLGVREGAFIFFLGKLNVPMGTAFILSLLIFFLGIILSSPGMIFYLQSGLSPKNSNELSLQNEFGNS